MRDSYVAVCSDSHRRVQEASRTALSQIAKVIKNPELRTLTPALLRALEDPTHTAKFVQELRDTRFMHALDAPSLSLIIPVIVRSFDDRSTETRRSACAIIASLYHLTDQKDIVPYVDALLPGVQKSLMDPVPNIRAVAAKALGSMVGAANGELFERLQTQVVPWLKKQLVSNTSSVDRSGAAQGLAEVLLAMETRDESKGDQLALTMPNIITTSLNDNVDSAVRDGYLMLYIFLPMVFSDRFREYLPSILPAILKALADENEQVRETALKAAQRQITTYAESAIELLLPQLELGMSNDNWRIRLASVQLIGDLLYKLSGVSGKMTTETRGDDETFGTETANKAIARALGGPRRNRLFAALFVSRWVHRCTATFSDRT